MNILFLLEKTHVTNVKNYNQFLYHLFVKLGNVTPFIEKVNDFKPAFFIKEDKELVHTKYITIKSDKYSIDVCDRDYIHKSNHAITYDLGVYFTKTDLFDESLLSDGTYTDACNILSSISQKYKVVHYDIDEKPPNIDNHVDTISKSKLLTSTTSNSYDKYSNIFSDFNLALIYYYYASGYNFLNTESLEVKKQNVLGFYHMWDYNTERDSVISSIYKKFKDTTLIKNYSNWYTSSWENYTNLIFHDAWSLNFSTSYTDFIKSSVGFISESVANPDVESNDSEIGRFTEKLFKEIFFSKYNIPFIIHVDGIVFKKLNERGFWFLNFEFIDFNKFDNSHRDEQYTLILESIDSSVEYLIELYDKYSNIDDVNTHIQSKFNKNLKNNSLLFDSVLNQTELSTDIFNFITSD